MPDRRRPPAEPARVREVRWEQVPKPDGGVRGLVRLDPADASRWARAIASAAPSIGRSVGPESHANRVMSWHPSNGPALEPWRRARRRWRRDVHRLGRDARWLAVTDARACYPSIRGEVVVTRLLGMGVPPEAVTEIGSWLRAFRDLGIEGLPIGPTPSAVVAEAVLSAGDDAIRSAGAAHVRWVDDVVIFAADRWTGIRALDALRRGWRAVGLDLHDGKTAILSDPGGVARVARAGAASSVPPRTLR